MKVIKNKSLLTNNNGLLMNNKGMGTVEIILIIVVLIGLVLIFKTQITELVTTVFDKITLDSNSILS